jgi:hypothetical protein
VVRAGPERINVAPGQFPGKLAKLDVAPILSKRRI